MQKQIIQKANILGRPVITATQMLMSMTDNIRPTRAEVTDVANAILDGTDAVMLSEETSIGKYPVETVAMMAKIARSTEEKRPGIGGGGAARLPTSGRGKGREKITVNDVVSLNVIEAIDALGIRLVLTPTRSGSTPPEHLPVQARGLDPRIHPEPEHLEVPGVLLRGLPVLDPEREGVLAWGDPRLDPGLWIDQARRARDPHRRGLPPGREGTDSLIILTVD